jgi:hypothetical protein
VHPALAVPTPNGASHPDGGGVRLLSIDGGPTRVDLVLSAATPIGLLIPPIVDILTRSGGFRPGPLAATINSLFRAAPRWTPRRHWPNWGFEMAPPCF